MGNMELLRNQKVNVVYTPINYQNIAIENKAFVKRNQLKLNILLMHSIVLSIHSSCITLI